MYWNLSGLATVLACAAAVAFSATGPVPTELRAAHPDAAPAIAPDAPPAIARQAGAVAGTLTLRPRPQRRTVNRYGGAPTVAAVQEIPPVVYLEGRVGPPPEPMTDVVMAQEDTAFAPPLLVVTTGTTVRFPNHDPFFHNVFSYSAAQRFDLGRYPQGESKQVTFDDPGLVKVYCEVHESMRSAILVMETPFWAKPDADGRFRIEGVPEGRYTLVAWQADRGTTETDVEVPADGVARVELEL